MRTTYLAFRVAPERYSIPEDQRLINSVNLASRSYGLLTAARVGTVDSSDSLALAIPKTYIFFRLRPENLRSTGSGRANYEAGTRRQWAVKVRFADLSGCCRAKISPVVQIRPSSAMAERAVNVATHLFAGQSDSAHWCWRRRKKLSRGAAVAGSGGGWWDG